MRLLGVASLKRLAPLAEDPSADWQDYMTRNLMEPVYMNGAEYGRYRAARQPEFTRFISDLGLAGKK